MKNDSTSVEFFRIGTAELVEGHGTHAFPLHTHAVFCIGVVTEGKLLVQFGNEKPCLLTTHQVYFIPPLTPHTICPAEDTPYGYCAVCVPSASPAGSVHCKQRVFPDEAFGEELLTACRAYKESGDSSRFYPIIEDFIRQNIVVSSIADQNRQLAEDCADYIQTHLNEPFSLQRLSRYVHVSKYHLVRCFEAQMGVAPYRYYLQAKVKKIRQGLLQEQSPADLAYSLQFTDQSHLCNVFKRFVGITPRRFKSSYRKR